MPGKAGPLAGDGEVGTIKGLEKKPFDFISVGNIPI